MTKLLRQVIAEIEKLPEDQQDAIASRLLTDLKDEQAWATRFKATTDDQWERAKLFHLMKSFQLES